MKLNLFALIQFSSIQIQSWFLSATCNNTQMSVIPRMVRIGWGKEITITPYGTNIIKNKDGYPFYINTQAELGESFGAFILFGMQVVMATVTDHDTLTFLGVQDSVKTYTLQVYNDYNQPVNHPLNGITFKISKDHGFVQTLNFSLFPDLSNWNPLGGESLESYDLVGLTSPEVGVQNLTWMDVHDFQPGDEIHVFYNIYMWGSIAQIEANHL
jgi:hypothetical protein